MLNLNTNLKINNEINLKNRVVVPPMASGTSLETGLATEGTYEHYKTLAKSGASLVMVEYTFVHPSGRSEKNQLGIYSDEHMHEISPIAGIIKSAGAYSAIQLVHGGAKSNHELTGGNLIGPSSVIIPTKNGGFERPRAASIEDIKVIKECFINSIGRSLKAGFDIIEIHAAHGYGLNQWLSPLTNKREDQYGGNLENRGRILFEIIEEAITLYPSLILSVRIPGADHLDGGLNFKDMIYISKKLESLGVSILNISSGIGGWRRPRNKVGEGYLVEDSSRIKAHVKIPVIGVGGIKTAGYINESLNQNRFSMAAVGRAILNNYKWGESVGLV